MNKQSMMTRITLWMNRLTALAVLTMLIGLQPLNDWYV